MNIDIWSDIVCPFCFIGKRQIELAIEKFEYKDELVVTYHSFELDPNAQKDNPLDIYDMLSLKYSMTREEAKANNARLAENAKAIGITLNFDDVKLTNSFDAHRLIHFASSKNKQSEMTEALHKAFFTDGLSISDIDTLVDLAKEIGLDTSESRKMLESDQFTSEVRQDESKAQEIGITGVPFFVIDMKYGISGAQGEENLLAALNEAWAER